MPNELEQPDTTLLYSTLHYRLLRTSLKFSWIVCAVLLGFLLLRGANFWDVLILSFMGPLTWAIHVWVMPQIRNLKQLDMLSVPILVLCFAVCSSGFFYADNHQIAPQIVFLTAFSALVIYRNSIFWGLFLAALAMSFGCIFFSGHQPSHIEYVSLLILVPWIAIIIRSIVNSHYEELYSAFSERESLVNELSTAIEDLKNQKIASTLARKETALYEAEHLKAVQQGQSYERKLLRLQKMENLGLVAGAVAHDFNNYLAAIVSFSESLLESVDDDTKPTLDQIKATALKAAGVAEQMVDQSSKLSEPEPTREVLNLNQLLLNAEPFLRAVIPKKVKFEIASSSSPVWIEADELAIQQLVMNLLKNAAEASHSDKTLSGKVFVLVSNHRSASLSSRASIGRVSSDCQYCQIEVRDNGTGILESDLEDIFEPNFTTKQEGHGFGMVIVKRITLDHGGMIEIEDNSPTGTCVRIVLPMTDPPETVEQVVIKTSGVSVESQKRMVLLVDDEQSVLDSVSMLLNAKGNSVIAVANPDDAMAQMEIHHADVDCLILDFSMPGSNGLELLNRIRSKGWAQPAILCSGFIMTLDDHPNAQFWPDEFLAKPYKFEQLQRAMDKVCRNKLGNMN